VLSYADSDLKLADNTEEAEKVLEKANGTDPKLHFDKKHHQLSLDEEIELKDWKKPSDSQNSPTKSKTDADEDEASVPRIKFMRLLRVNSPEWLYILLGILSSAAMGGVMPIFSLLFGDVTGILAYQDTAQARDESVYYAVLFGALGLGSTLAMFLQGLMFGISGRLVCSILVCFLQGDNIPVPLGIWSWVDAKVDFFLFRQNTGTKLIRN
jgi:hypothetical protein